MTKRTLLSAGAALLLAAGCVHELTAADYARQASQQLALAEQARKSGNVAEAEQHLRAARQAELRAQQKRAEDQYFENDTRQVNNAKQGPVPATLPPP